MAKTSRCVVRNAANRRGNLGDRYRHNERHNTDYGNGDIDISRAYLNVRFRACEGSYTDAFDKLVRDGVVSLRGLGKDPKIVDEMVFDVNTAYFENHGGYEYAKAFFAEAYKLAVKEAGGEQYILSAVMHADERNRALSEQLGRDVYHYHLHVVYVPVVDKEIKWSKRCKDPALVGTVREVIKQVSHSKKWPRETQYDEQGEVVRNEKGKAVLVNSYSLLQDRFFEHMRAAGFSDFERGERGSTAEHLSTLDYKIKQDTARSAALEKKVSSLDEKLSVREKAAVTHSEIDQMGKRKMSGKVEVSADNWEVVSTLAKKGVSADAAISDVQRQLAEAQRNAAIYKQRSDDAEGYRKAYAIDPKATQAALDNIYFSHLTRKKKPHNLDRQEQKFER